MTRRIVPAALALVLGLAVGHVVAGTTAAGHDLATSPGPATGASSLTRTELEQVVRHELARARPPGDSRSTCTDHAVADTEDVVARSAETTEGADRARIVVDGAKARGVWTDADHQALRDHLDGLPGATQSEIFARMSDAVNRGELRITGDLPL